YAEILLSYAEALNQLGSESFTIDVDGESQTFSRDINEIKWAYNQVRYRAGLPGLTDADLADANEVLKKIKRERMVEFLFENRRYFDVRRWGDYEASEGETIIGMNTAAGKDAYYQRVVPGSSRIARRIVDRKMIFVPIPKIEMKRLPSFDQNPGW
ncbi:MAG: RagB/SusD family nutrient uptake outer membrane protein, partial [Bacteroidales bacterium]|nr:RagB/SusD family nutrient uptake outer membrane protein [Bacteroidales bacterium]